MERFWHAFIPLCVAFDAVGVLPLFWGLAQHLSVAKRHQAVTEAVFTASLVALGFLFLSRWVFAALGLELSDLMMAGGAILLVLSLRDLLFPGKAVSGTYASPGVVPLGVPLLAGPAALTTMLLLQRQYGWAMTLLVLAANMVLAWVTLRSAEWLIRRLGRDGAHVVSKIANLVLAAYGVMLIRRGIGSLMDMAGH